MSSGQKTVSVFLMLISSMLVLILGLYVSWPLWAWPVAVLLLGASWAGATATASRSNRGKLFPDTVTAPPVPEVERRELSVRDVALPSALDDYDFLLSATVRWCPEKPYAQETGVHHGGLAVEAVLARAGELTAGRDPFRSSLVQHELSGALAEMRHDRTGHIRVMALDVVLRLSEEDQRRLDRLAAIRKDEELWEHERKWEKNRRAYLGEDVLRDTGRAVVWWLAKNEDHVEKTVQDIGLLAQLSSAANNERVAEPFRHLVPEAFSEVPVTGAEVEAERGPADQFTDFMQGLGFSPGADDCVLLAEQVAMAIKDKDVAEEIRRRFAPSPAEDEDADGEEPEPPSTGLGPAAEA
ncbi:hypothetical protein AB0I00_34785 [Streptomyces sp. NPDC050803]|uniref:hypothetical protein n=1 Tax=unclassified Streptomyces TaxID=2593676 RepID=UPI0034164804